MDAAPGAADRTGRTRRTSSPTSRDVAASGHRRDRVAFRWGAVTVDCADPAVLASFWVALLGGEVSEPLPGWRRLSVRGNPDITFQPVPEPKRGKTRLHLDLVVDDLDRAHDAIARLGGGSAGVRHRYPEGVVVVMTDPEGTEFCIVRYTG